MPLTVPMPFDAETLMDFDCGPSAGVCSAWPSNPTDYDSDPLLMVSLPSVDRSEDQGLLKDSSFGENDWKCKNYRRLNPAPRQKSSFQLWSPRLKQRDERKRVLKMSLAKLRRIDDTESCLGRYVLLSNTLRRLQREARDEKASAMDRLQQHHHHQHWQPEGNDARLEHPAAAPVAKSLLSTDQLPSPSEESPSSGVVADQNRPAAIKRRRSSEDETDSLNLSDLYLPPPTPRLISSLDSDDDVVDVVTEDDPWCKKAKTTDDSDVTQQQQQRSRPALRPCNQVTSPVTSPANTTTSTTTTLVSGYAAAASAATSSQPYSCGQSSLFGELQSVVFHSLITSLES